VSRPSLSSAEAAAAFLTLLPASIVLVAYSLDRTGHAFSPAPMLAATLVSGAAAFAVLHRWVDPGRRMLGAFGAIVGATFAWLMWIARPTFFPLGTGPDLTHHLLLIHFIEQHWRLVHDAGVEPFLGEMIHYTPGSHILVALTAAWTGSRGLHVLHPVMAAVAALKAGLVALIAMRILPRDVPRQPIATLAAVSLLASQTFFLGSFLEYSFLAQVVAELFAVGAWWVLIVWDERPNTPLMVIVGMLGAALFLTWPILIGPPLVTLGILTMLPSATPRWPRMAQAAVAVAIVAVFAALFMSGRTAWVQLAGTSGKTAWPTVEAYGWPFLLTSSIGLLLACRRRQTRATAIFAAATLAQSGALYWLARRAGNTPYMALKMCYPFLCVQAAGVAVFVGDAWQAAVRVLLRGRPASSRWSVLEIGIAWAGVGAVAIFLGWPLRHAPRALHIAFQPTTSLPLERAADWTRAHLPAACVEYLVGDDETAYWLHLAALGNPRMSARTADNDTFELAPTIVRWLTPGGLPYAIADLTALPRDVREDLDVIARFDPAVVARKHGAGPCPP
jgi:hypothetical protein